MSLADAATLLAAVTPIAKLVAELVGGETTDKADVARRLASAALDLVPEEELHAYLTDEARARADLAFEVAKAAKLEG